MSVIIDGWDLNIKEIEVWYNKKLQNGLRQTKVHQGGHLGGYTWLNG